MTISEFEFQQMKARVDKTLGREDPEEDHEPDPGPEERLAGKIMEYCKAQGFPNV